VPCRAKPALDFSDNCIVDFADIRLMAGDWLESDIALGTTTAPNSPVLHYAFDVDESGSTITDSSGNDYHGMFFVDANQLAGDIRGRVDPNGKSGNSFHFQANDAGDLDYAGIKIPSAVFSTISQDVTVSLWVKNVHSDERPDGGASLFDFRPWDGVSTDANDTVLGVDVDGRGDDYTFVDESDDVGYDHDWDAHLGWEHYAFVRNDSNLAIYVNGVLKEIDDSNGSPIPKPDLLYLGIASDRAPDHPDGFHDGFTGNVDEFKIFDYALSAAEIAYIADHDDNGIYEMESPYNIWSQELIGSRAVNFKDYAVLIDDWLEEILWP